MALTATATLTRKFITSSLCMRSDNTHIVNVPLVKHNIAYCVAEKSSGGIPEAFGSIIKRIKEDKDIGRMIIFCRTYKAVTSIFYYDRTRRILHKTNGITKICVVDMCTHCTHASIRNKIQHYFTTQSPLKIVIATIAFSLGVNCPNVRQMIHWGVPEDCETYV